MYLFEKDEDSTVQQALLVSMSLYSNGNTSFYSNIMELSKSYNLPDFVPNNLEQNQNIKIYNIKKARALIGQLPISYLSMGE